MRLLLHRVFAADFFARTFAWLILPVVICAAGCASPMPQRGAQSAWRIGPFVERAVTTNGASFFAIHPIFSRESAPESAAENIDILWPVATKRARDDRSRRSFMLLFYGGEATNDNSTYTRLLPFWFSGQTGEGETYRALFPLGGEIHNFLLVDNFRFVLFPLYGSSHHNETEMRTILWPFYLTRRGPNVDQLRMWPFYGTRTSRRLDVTRENGFIMWPFWQTREIRGEKVRGSSWMFFPFYGRSHAESAAIGEEDTWWILPPLFKYASNSRTWRSINAPWPIVRISDDEDRHARHVWPIFGTEETPDGNDWYAAWPFFSGRNRKSADEISEELTLFLIFFRRHIAEVGGETKSAVNRLWPLYSYRESRESSRFRFPELSPFANHPAIERNWAPLWSLFVRETRADGSYSTDILWGFLSWGRHADSRRHFSLFWIPFRK